MSTKKKNKRQASDESGDRVSDGDDGGRRGTKDDGKKKDGKTQNTIIQ